MTETLFAWFGSYGPWLLLVGVFLDVAGLVPIPGEIYLLIAGHLARTGNLNFLWVVLLGALGAFLGDHVTFYLGRRGGPLASFAGSRTAPFLRVTMVVLARQSVCDFSTPSRRPRVLSTP